MSIVSVPGKIILSGDIAVAFGQPGIAVPSSLKLTATFVADESCADINLNWKEIENNSGWKKYTEIVINHCIAIGNVKPGTLTIENEIPLGKGMGSSTALVIAVSRCLLGEDCHDEALSIEDSVNPGHSGIDFAVSWSEKPLLLKKGESKKEIERLKNLDTFGDLPFDSLFIGVESFKQLSMISSILPYRYCLFYLKIF